MRPSTEILPLIKKHPLGSSVWFVHQKRNLWELAGFDTRNQYAILHPNGEEVLFAAEQGGLGAAFLRQFAGHWRTFTFRFFNPMREELMTAHHPFRFFTDRLEVSVRGQDVGVIQSRRNWLGPRWKVVWTLFDILDSTGKVLFELKGSLGSPWTFPIYRNGRQVAVVEKQWSDFLSEVFTNNTHFKITFRAPSLNEAERSLILASVLLIDLTRFERKLQ